MPKIQACSEVDGLPSISPAKNYIPSWYPKTSVFVQNDKMETSPAVKSCFPFRDSFSTGYMAELWEDIIIEQGVGGSRVKFLQDQGINIINHKECSYHEIREKKQYSYVKFKLENMESVCRFNWDRNPVLIKTDVPHNVEMLSDTGRRWCASIRFNVNDFDKLKSIFEAHY